MPGWLDDRFLPQLRNMLLAEGRGEAVAKSVEVRCNNVVQGKKGPEAPLFRCDGFLLEIVDSRVIKTKCRKCGCIVFIEADLTGNMIAYISPTDPNYNLHLVEQRKAS